MADHKEQFDLVRVKYRQMGGVVRGLNEEWNNFVKKHRTWREDLPLLMTGLLKEETHRTRLLSRNKFVPAMKHFQTWINGRWWTIDLRDEKQREQEIERKRQKKQKIQQREFWEDFLKGKTINELREFYKDPQHTSIRWLIIEIVKSKKGQLISGN